MKYPKDRQMFSVKEFSRACGVSRTSLIRMEESGVLTPFYVDPDTGYRYYDAHNAAEVGQYQLVQTLGLSRSEIADYYLQRCDVDAFIAEQKERLNQMKRVLEVLEIRHDPSRHFSFAFVDLPEMLCYCVTKKLTSPEESEAFFYSVHEESIKKGFRMRGTIPIFGMNEYDFKDQAEHAFTPHEVTACIPIDASDEKQDDMHVVTFPAVHAFSGLAYGDYRIITEFCGRFWQEVEDRNIRVTGRACLVGLLAPYVNKHIAPTEFCYRLVVPVEEIF